MMRVLFSGGVFAAVFALASIASASDALLEGEVKSLEGEKVDLSKYKGKVVLVVNVASKCGKTPQYKPLQALYEKYHDQGLEVVGFPCNQFGGQEPGTLLEIREFCTDKYNVTFDMMEKIDVNGPETATIYKKLKSFPRDPGDVKWNFEKFLIGRDGAVVERFRSPVEPDSADVVKKIETELKKD
ncbi:glutathione peroxidase [Blastopirellula retiformator]|uniref:Glutathione peroxidase n=1 Tax=Blastopirellula retiformator TaxID=2527970 RepID=A0A5C5V510_9BACT|nr:glutathione peroxidase [Blastopirellula retiformator]TWT32815.1 Hydroperoxy fatty acid reductase gpx1 [Blastopirellula retiformator]